MSTFAPSGRDKLGRYMGMRLVIGITGASGVIYGVELIRVLHRLSAVEIHLILTDAGKRVLRLEMHMGEKDLEKMVSAVYSVSDLGAPPASGSWLHQGMVICPCTMASLGAIANGIGDDLLVRSADVSLKERRKLILVVRETPVNIIHLENMLRVARAGGLIMPASPPFYHRPEKIMDLVRHMVARILDQLGISNNLTPRWEGE